ncbi:MAG: YibE/F family protein [Patescibacteria group bacterium]
MKRILKNWIVLVVGIILIFQITNVKAFAAEPPRVYSGTIIEALENNDVIVEVKKETSVLKFQVKTFAENYISKPVYKVGDRVIISVDVVKGKEVGSIIERERVIPYAIIIALFFGVVAAIGRFRGVLSIFAMMASFLFLTSVTIPQIIAGVDPVMMSLLTGIIIVPLTFYISHGFTTKTSLAVIATLIALAITGVLAVIFTQLVYLTGYTSDEATAVTFRFGQNFQLSNILIAGMIISSMGVLDDVTISQIDIVASLSKAKPDMKRKVLFAEAMKIGRDHIASLVNTLVLVYVGAALPLFLVIYKSDTPLWIVLQKESIAEEVVRTIVSSIGIILAVPISTFLGVRWGRKKVGLLQKEKLF